jgi:AraC-like DNA-binding protein
MPSDSIHVAATLLDRLAELGVDIETVRSRAGLAAGRFEAGNVRLTTNEFFAFWRAVDAAAGSRELGLALGSQALDHGYSVACVAALHARSVAEALRSLGRYKRITCPEQVEIEIARGEASLRFHWILAETAVPRLLVDSTFASFAALARRGTGTDLAPRRVELARRRSDARMLREHFGCEIRFGAPVDRLVFDESALAIPFVTHDAQALERLVPGLEAELAGHAKTRSFCDDVRVAIARHMGVDRPTVHTVARRLHMSSRTLQRRLEAEHTSYQEKLDEVRNTTARRLLATTDLEIVEVAFLLGFEEPNSFARAFRGWEGVTPLRWRGRDEQSSGRVS